ncbi:DUF4421 domain-containing protein [Brucepastera parasyntrophica]|uniref:DUF4421 family protein n=1 Tax=Brucepastera parasyntrophica TaxID=2880008 RepID=UPI00210BA2EE|nr:DUF4421 family protein [Brucepastera parasyntrophica]ULQ60463.1 DUF4421 domain-containing protein [Brucepastera parasyntrophica]
MAGTGAAEEGYIQSFDSKLAFTFFLNYNFTNFNEGETDREFTTNRPMDFGIGISYKRLAFSLSYNVPFFYDGDFKKSESLVLQLQYFHERFLLDLSYKNFEGFHQPDPIEFGGEADLKLTNIGVFSQYIWNNERHSLRAAYTMNEKQLRSSGSLLLGAGVFYTSVVSDDSLIEQYNRKRYFIQFGPNAGYSWTWVIIPGMFLNLSLSAGLHMGVDIEESRLFFAPGGFPAFSFGYSAERWSYGVTASLSLLTLNAGRENFDLIFSGKCVMMFVLRL